MLGSKSWTRDLESRIHTWNAQGLLVFRSRVQDPSEFEFGIHQCPAWMPAETLFCLAPIPRRRLAPSCATRAALSRSAAAPWMSGWRARGSGCRA